MLELKNLNNMLLRVSLKYDPYFFRAHSAVQTDSSFLNETQPMTLEI